MIIKKEITSNIKDQLAEIIETHGKRVWLKTISLYWEKYDIYLILWCNKVFMYSQTENGEVIKGLFDRFNDDDLYEIIEKYSEIT